MASHRLLKHSFSRVRGYAASECYCTDLLSRLSKQLEALLAAVPALCNRGILGQNALQLRVLARSDLSGKLVEQTLLCLDDLLARESIRASMIWSRSADTEV